MTPKQRKPLLEAIEHWKEIERGEGVDLGEYTCALCMEFECCEGCPVAEHVENYSCGGTPWIAWNDEQLKLGRHLWRMDSNERVADTPELQSLATAEREFLESLLKGK